MPEPIHISITANAAYARYAAITLWSLLAHTSSPVRVHLLDCGLNPVQHAAYRRLMTAHGDASIEFAPCRPLLDRHPDIPERYKTTLVRLTLPEVLPDVTRCLHLDSDLVVLDDVATLFATPLDGHAVAAVTNLRTAEKHHVARSRWRWLHPKMVRQAREEAARLQRDAGLGALTEHINAGVLLLDLDVIRARIGVERFGDLAAAGRLAQFDQDWIAGVARGDILRLDPRWNTYSSMARLNLWAFPPDEKAALERARARPAIVHFVGSKPWGPAKSHAAARRRKRDPWVRAWRGAAAGMDAFLASHATDEAAALSL
ncbi:glycosyltransferase [Acuticoccus sp. MNP-M23]|uniref:glycosyltransferase family 8 protein n=1 Tax=Acuticoccus sp. MNP-M23 TaxID=3072793 RepID=UPI0028164719|nr:glycosyltransferase [Acuticoccus sp. MNP-M23]WMS44101.1 glycosyltransferase [Acuticoccus sp. MNP-M23]